MLTFSCSLLSMTARETADTTFSSPPASSTTETNCVDNEIFVFLSSSFPFCFLPVESTVFEAFCAILWDPPACKTAAATLTDRDPQYSNSSSLEADLAFFGVLRLTGKVLDNFDLMEEDDLFSFLASACRVIFSSCSFSFASICLCFSAIVA